MMDLRIIKTAKFLTLIIGLEKNQFF